MALSKPTLSALIKTKIEAQMGAADNSAQLVKFCDAIADAVISHILSNAVVNVTSVSGVTAGVGNSGTGLGTIT